MPHSNDPFDLNRFLLAQEEDYEPALAESRSSVRGLARSGAVAGIIKLASAGLSFAMFVVIALVTDERQFGLYSAAYAGASLVSFFAVMGQQSTVLRFWPQYARAGRTGIANGLMGRSMLVTLGGLVTSSLILALIGLVPALGDKTPEWLPLCLSAAVLSFALGWSEFASGAYRAKSALLSALLPRDVFWRADLDHDLVQLHFFHFAASGADLDLHVAIPLAPCLQRNEDLGRGDLTRLRRVAAQPLA